MKHYFGNTPQDPKSKKITGRYAKIAAVHKHGADSSEQKMSHEKSSKHSKNQEKVPAKGLQDDEEYVHQGIIPSRR